MTFSHVDRPGNLSQTEVFCGHLFAAGVYYRLQMASNDDGVTQLLRRWRDGDRGAAEELMPLIYRELHKLAKRYMNQEGAGQTLQTTALIHEAYLKLGGGSDGGWENRAHFFGVAAKAMRHVLVDHARARRAGKRGGYMQIEPLEEGADVGITRAAELIALDDALTSLGEQYPRQAEVVELRYFGGFTVEETAGALKVSPETIARDWHFAKALLRSALAPGGKA